MATDIRMKKEILRILAAAPAGGCRLEELLEVLGHLDLKRFRRLLREMRRTELIVEEPRGRWRLREEAPEIVGVLSVNSHGFGFVAPQCPGEGGRRPDVFIPPGRIGGALSGDQVRVRITCPEDRRGPSGEIVEVLRRGYTRIVGAYVEQGGSPAVRPLRRELPPVVPLVCPEEGRAAFARIRPGDWIQAELRPGGSPEELTAVFRRRLAASGRVKADLDAIVKEYDLPRQYTETMERNAAGTAPLEVPREDLTGLPVLTMDPADARDYDDALSYQDGPGEDECTVGVHIADVACFVQRGGPLDKAAARRGFTSYLPGRTIPMLPHALADSACSLQAGVPRLAHTVMIRLDRRNGAVLGWRRFHSVVKVGRRLCYEEAADLFAGRPVALPPEIRRTLLALLDVSRKMRDRRRETEMFIPMEMPEIRVLCTEQPSRILGVREVEHDEAHGLVEEFMLAANQCVALDLQRRRIPAVFRDHLEPEEDALAEFSLQAGQMLGHQVKGFRTRRELVRFLAQVNRTPLRDIIGLALLRHLPRAFYGVENQGHFGLGKKDYCHFTSPIRRYSDLAVHQQLLAVDLHRKTRTREEMQALAQTVSAQEENCDQAAFAAADRLKLRYLMQLREEDPGLTLQASVIRAARMGVMVYVGAYGLMAAVAREDFPEGDWLFDGREMAWTDRTGRRKLQVRDQVSCLVKSIDPVRGELALAFRKPPADGRAGRAARPRRKRG